MKLLPLFLVSLVSALVGGLVGATLMGGDGGGQMYGADASGQILTELRRIASAMERQQAAPSGPEVSAVERVEATTDGDQSSSAELVMTLDALREQIAAEAARTREALGLIAGGPGFRPPSEAYRSKGEPDRQALAELGALWESDQGAVRKSLMFATPAQLISRFGPPVRIDATDNCVLWWLDTDGDNRPNLQVQVRDGYAFQVW